MRCGGVCTATAGRDFTLSIVSTTLHFLLFPLHPVSIINQVKRGIERGNHAQMGVGRGTPLSKCGGGTPPKPFPASVIREDVLLRTSLSLPLPSLLRAVDTITHLVSLDSKRVVPHTLHKSFAAVICSASWLEDPLTDSPVLRLVRSSTSGPGWGSVSIARRR